MTPDGGSIPPTGRSFSVPATMVATLQDGRVVRLAHYFDLMTLLTALGVMPAAQPA
jgi:ketosteroid isomerase-like protein